MTLQFSCFHDFIFFILSTITRLTSFFIIMPVWVNNLLISVAAHQNVIYNWTKFFLKDHSYFLTVSGISRPKNWLCSFHDFIFLFCVFGVSSADFDKVWIFNVYFDSNNFDINWNSIQFNLIKCSFFSILSQLQMTYKL